MKRYAIRYVRIPTNYNTPRAAVVEAESPEIVLELLKHKLGDHSGVNNHVYGEPAEYVPPASKGHVLDQSEILKLNLQ
jgi:hypothetical protein